MCGVTECPVTNLFFVSRGWQQGRESATNEDTLVTLVKQLETSSCVPAMVVQSPFGPLFLSLCVLHVDSVTFSPLEGNRVPCEPKLIILETFRLYSKLISCTRKISTLHLEFKCVCGHPQARHSNYRKPQLAMGQKGTLLSVDQKGGAPPPSKIVLEKRTRNPPLLASLP